MQGKMKGLGFKMRGWSPFTQKEEHKKLKGADPKHPVTPPTEEESEKSKGKLTGKTGFEQDILDPVKDIALNAAKEAKSVIDPAKKAVKTFYVDPAKKIKNKVIDYFTKR